MATVNAPIKKIAIKMIRRIFPLSLEGYFVFWEWELLEELLSMWGNRHAIWKDITSL